jgi:uncharacterized membrane protein
VRVPSLVDRRQLFSAVVGLLLIGIVLVLPDLAPGIRSPEVVQAYRGEIVSVGQGTQGSNPDLPPVPVAKVKMLEGPQAGQTVDAYMNGPGGSQTVADYKPGEAVVVTITDDQDGRGPVLSVSDRWRLPALEILVILFAASVVVVGGWHGVRALLALGLTIVVILRILLPLMIAGVPPVPLAVLSATGITVATILLTEGWNRSSAAAILGTTGAIAIIGFLAAAVTAVMGFSYTAGSDLAFLTTPSGQGLDLRGILLGAIILGAVGVLDDVTVTQAVLVNEIAKTSGMRGPRLFASGMGIGRSHIGATVNTLFLAYVGAGLPLLILLLVSAQPGALVFNDELIATEIVRTVVGSLGIVAAVPLTTYIAVSLAPAEGIEGGRLRSFGRQRLIPATVAGAVIAVLLLLTAALPLTAGPRTALTPPVLGPGPDASLGPGASSGPDGSAGAGESPGPEPFPSDATQPVVAVAKQAVPIDVDGSQVGTVAVMGWSFNPGRSAGDVPVSVDVRYKATAPFDLGTGSWELLFDDGSTRLLTFAASPPSSLAAGETRDLRVTGKVPTNGGTPFVGYVDAETGDFVFVVAAD